jgi:hypothetical protein
VDESNAGSLVLLRRTCSVQGRHRLMNFINEPYICGEHVEGAPLLGHRDLKRYLAWPVAPSAWNTG